MAELKKFVDIERVKAIYMENFVAGEPIVVECKIDGSNASFSCENGEVFAFSRRKELEPQNSLNGFYDFVQMLDKDIVTSVLGDRYVVFGEWLTPHSINYDSSMYKKFYMYDVYDKEIGQYLPYEEALAFYEKLKPAGVTEFVKTLYIGPFVSYEHLLSLLEENPYNAKPVSEGIVIKRQSQLDSKSSKNPFYIKIVNEIFSEVHTGHKEKNIDPEQLAAQEREKETVRSIVTERRAEKIIQKLIEDNELPADWDEHNLKDLSKVMPKLMYADCMKEEPDIVKSIENFGKVCAKITMEVVRGMVK